MEIDSYHTNGDLIMNRSAFVIFILYVQKGIPGLREGEEQRENPSELLPRIRTTGELPEGRGRGKIPFGDR